MELGRRAFIRSMVIAAPAVEANSLLAGQARNRDEFDVAVIGAGVFGAWTAYHLQRAGSAVVLLDAYGAGNSRASSGGESRIIRMGYGADEIYTRWSMRSLDLWQQLLSSRKPPLFYPTGVLWMARKEDEYSRNTLRTLERVGIPFERLSRPQLEARYSQMAFGPITWGMLEPKSGVLLARRAVQAILDEAVRLGTVFRLAQAYPPSSPDHTTLRTGPDSFGFIRAKTYVFACGPWLPKLFPDLLGHRIYPTRQEVFFFGTPRGDNRFQPEQLPAWIDFGEEIYGTADLEGRGVKIAPDRHGPPFDPDTGERLVTDQSMQIVRRFMSQRFPALKDAPLIEARVCQYENTSSGDFLIDRHPSFPNVWLVGGGSGHGFKHGPVLGEYVAERIQSGGSVDARFSLATKGTVQKRAVY